MSRFRKSYNNSKHGGSRKQRRHSGSRKQRRHGGATAFVGAPLSYQLQDQALAQGKDFLSYHKGQHGGATPLALTPLDAIDNSALAGQLRGPAMLGGIDKAFADIAGFKDQQGGKRRRRRSKRSGKKGGKRSKRSKKGGKRSKRSKRSKRTKRSKRSKKCRRTRRSHGGAMGFAPFPSQGMLLSPAQTARAGLSQGWVDAVEFDAAKMRSAE